MPGTIIGGIKASETNKKRYGDDHYKKIGAKGGKKSKGGGFAYDDRTFIEKLMRKPKRATIAGQKGGKASRRTKLKGVRIEVKNG